MTASEPVAASQDSTPLASVHAASRREAAVSEAVAAALKTEGCHLNASPDAPPLTMDDLNPVEQAAASLGVNPVSVKPISWLNEKHYDALVSGNALTPDLSRRIAAYKTLSEESTKMSGSNGIAAHPPLVTSTN